MTDPSAWRTTVYDAGTRCWVENLSATGRRQATSVSASKLRQWVNRTLEERPSRGELRAWIELVLDERRALHNKAEALTKENEALTAQRDDALEMVKTLDADRTRRTKERDRAAQNLYERTVEWTKRYDELDEAYGQAEAERNNLARSRGNRWRWDGSAWHRLDDGRASCSCTEGTGAK